MQVLAQIVEIIKEENADLLPPEKPVNGGKLNAFFILLMLLFHFL
jgi:hypothetical protein